MEDEIPAHKRFTINGWEPRWGHIGMFLVIVGLVVLTWFVFHHNNLNKPTVTTKNPPVSSHAQTHHPVANKPSKSTPSTGTSTTNPAPASTTPSTPSPSQSGSSVHGSQPNSSSTQKNSTSTQALANTGPGDEVGLFVMSTFSGTIAYNIYLRRKFSRQI